MAERGITPAQWAAIIQLIRTGALTRDTQVWTDGMAQWAPLGSTPLAQYVAAAPPALSAASGEEAKPGLPAWVNLVGGVVGAIIGFVAVKYAFKVMSGELIARFVGGGIAGALCGLIPFFVGRKRGNKLGTVGLCVCIPVGMFFGIILALPTAIVFTIIIVSQKPGAPG